MQSVPQQATPNLFKNQHTAGLTKRSLRLHWHLPTTAIGSPVVLQRKTEHNTKYSLPLCCNIDQEVGRRAG